MLLAPGQVGGIDALQLQAGILKITAKQEEVRVVEGEDGVTVAELR